MKEYKKKNKNISCVCQDFLIRSDKYLLFSRFYSYYSMQDVYTESSTQQFPGVQS